MSVRSVGQGLGLVEPVLSLPQVQLGARHAHRVDERQGGDAAVAGRAERDGSSFAVADERDAIFVDVLALAQEPDHGSEIFDIVAERRRLRPAAALADTALVVPDDEESLIGERVGQLAEDRNA